MCGLIDAYEQNGSRLGNSIITHWYKEMLSGAAGRVMIRDWIEGSFTDLVKNINQWFDDFSIIARDGNKLTQAPKFMAVAGALVRDLKDLPAPQLQQLWHTAINNSFIPYNALSQATLRARIDIINIIHHFMHAWA